MFTEIVATSTVTRREEQPEDVVGLGRQLHRVPDRLAVDGLRAGGDEDRRAARRASWWSAGRASGPRSGRVWPAPKRVKSGMFRESVDQKPIMPISEGKKTGQKSAPQPSFGRLVEQRAEAARLDRDPDQQHQRADDHEGRGPVLEAAQGLHAPVDDGQFERPEERRSRATASRGSPPIVPGVAPSCRRRSCPAGSRSPAADPGLDAEPAAGDAPPGSAPGRLAPRSPKEARARTGNGMPYLGPACPVSSIGSSTITLARAMVNTACFQSMPRATSPEASVQDGMLWAMPTHRAAKLYVVQVRSATRHGRRSSLAKRRVGGKAPGASSTRPSAGG